MGATRKEEWPVQLDVKTSLGVDKKEVASLVRSQKMNKFMTFLLAALLTTLVPSIVQANEYDCTVDGVKWIYSVTNREAVIGTNPYRRAAINDATSGDLVIPSSLNGYPVTCIRYGAFSGCTNLTSIIIPKSVKSIGEGVFYGCTGLTSVTIPNSVTNIDSGAFYNNSIQSILVEDGNENYCSVDGVLFSKDMTTIIAFPGGRSGGYEIPGGVTNVGAYAFRGCKDLVSVTLPDCVMNIWNGAFWGCTKLTSMTISDRVTKIGSHTFYGCTDLSSVVLSDRVTEIGDWAFYGCKNLTSFTIPSSVESIGDKVFYGCVNLKAITVSQFIIEKGINVVFPDLYGLQINMCPEVTNIRSSAFSKCTNLVSVVIPDSVTNIGDRAFSQCTNLISVVIPESVVSLGDYVFDGCSSLASVKILGGMSRIGMGMFFGCINLVSVTMPDSVTNIGNYAFYNCKSLASIEMSNSLSGIGDWAFAECASLTSISLPNSVTAIGFLAFSGCTGLTSVTIPGSVNHIGDSAFLCCSNLTSVTIEDGVKSIEDNAFRGCSTLSSLTISSSVVNIGSYAFSSCSLPSVIIPSSVKTICTCAFSNNGITNVILSEGIETIKSSAFGECNLKSVIIPSSVKYIGTKAFGCDTLTDVTFEGLPVESVNDDSFQSGIVGYYHARHLKEWKAVIDSSGKWNKFTMIPIGDTITYKNLKGVANLNPSMYETGMEIEFIALTNVVGYTFVGWEPAAITKEMTGPQTVVAHWEGVPYTIRYDANGGEGEVDVTAAVYGDEVSIVSNQFTREYYRFAGWATERKGAAVYTDGQVVSNLTAEANGSVTLYAVWNVASVPAPVVLPADGSVFRAEACSVSLSCAVEEAKIYYTTNGVAPKFTDKYLYTKPFKISDSAEIWAVAVYGDMRSEITKAKIKHNTLILREVLGLESAAEVKLETDEEASWQPIEDETSILGMSAKSATIGNGEESWLKATVTGKGVFTFKWKVDCEDDYSGEATWDHLEVLVDGIELDRIDGASGWGEKVITFTTAGEHTIYWAYVKDEDASEAGHADCAWLTDCKWALEESFPEVTEGSKVSEVFDGATDARLAERIKTTAEYVRFRSWVEKVAKGDLIVRQNIKDSELAWFAYALDLEALPEKAPESLTIDTILSAAEGAWDLEVRVKDCEVGDGVFAADLGTVFTVEGAAELKEGAFSADNVITTFSAPENGKVKVEVEPKSAAGQFFIRVKMMP